MNNFYLGFTEKCYLSKKQRIFKARRGICERAYYEVVCKRAITKDSVRSPLYFFIWLLRFLWRNEERRASISVRRRYVSDERRSCSQKAGNPKREKEFWAILSLMLTHNVYSTLLVRIA